VVGAILLVLGLALYFLSRGVLLSGVENTVRTRAIVAAKIMELTSAWATLVKSGSSSTRL